MDIIQCSLILSTIEKKMIEYQTNYTVIEAATLAWLSKSFYFSVHGNRYLYKKKLSEEKIQRNKIAIVYLHITYPNSTPICNL